MYLQPRPPLPYIAPSRVYVCAAGAIWRKLSVGVRGRAACLRVPFLPLASVACAKFHNFCPSVTVATSARAAPASPVPRCLPVTCHSYRAINKTGGNVRTPSPSPSPFSPSLALTGASFVICSPYFDLFYVHFPALPPTLLRPAPPRPAPRLRTC